MTSSVVRYTHSTNTMPSLFVRYTHDTNTMPSLYIRYKMHAFKMFRLALSTSNSLLIQNNIDNSYVQSSIL